MLMMSIRTLLAATLALGAAAPAAAVNFTVTSTAYDHGAYAGYTLLCGSGNPACRTRWSGAYGIVSTDLVNRHVTPSGWSGEYAAVPGPLHPKGGSAIFSFAGVGPVTSWSFLWGSAGPSNVVELSYLGMGSPFVLSGNQIISTDLGETILQRSNRWVTVSGDAAFTPLEARFSHPSYSFEVTAFAVQPFIDGVPEPASWALLILGFGVVGAATRQARRIRFRLA